METPKLETEVSEMPKFRVPYPPEFRRQMVELVGSGRTAQDLAREFERNARSIAHWVRQTDREVGATNGGGGYRSRLAAMGPGPGLSGIPCVAGHDGKEGALPWPAANRLSQPRQQRPSH